MIDKRELCDPWLPSTDLGPILGITDSACKNQSVMVSVQYGPFNTNISIRSTTIGKSKVARDPITMHTSRRSNSDIACVTSKNTVNFHAESLHKAASWYCTKYQISHISQEISADYVNKEHYTQGRSDVNATGLVNSDVNELGWSTQMSTQRNLAMEPVLQSYERQPEIPVLLIKPEQHPDSTSITNYLDSSSNTAIHQKKNFVTIH
ncbi:hypothetical protein F511_36709 [Dorcoceras hygrometricum]|uniref:Uncharacterized protein n=1 Tax=Dorcoceras hygrometricum TaxID=472368 RepID=A0A2Z7A6D4_9LAMI|nr:hypothetical protein F511_36709 [Dorcoceras hygrometricum]